jgi:pSer/pThr/pTyr-binding forkhead associated (FHA) protein
MPPVKLQVVMSIPGKDSREFEYEFDQDKITIGRDQHNDIQVPLSTVSRSHANLLWDGREWYLEDLKSTHGTKHNGKPVGGGGKKLLRDSDVIDLVHFKITFRAEKQRSADYSVEKTEALARKMVEEVLAQIGDNAQGQPYVRVMNGPEEGKKFSVGPNVAEATIGRGNDCDFQINDANVSRRHAVIRRDWNEITVEDAGSKNGVVVNERRITKPTPLRDADEIMLGAMKLTFIDPSAKFLGKLDDIPAFQEQLTSAEPEDGEEIDAAEEDQQAEAPSEDAEEQAPPIDDEEPPEPGTRAKGTNASRAMGTNAMGGLEEDADAEAGPFDDDIPASTRTLGAAELLLIGLAVVAVIGLAVAVALLFSNG